MSGPTSKITDIGSKIKDVTAALAKADSELKWELAGTAADVAGMVDPTPASDLIGAGLSLRKGDFLGAGLSVASMVPYLGDALAKPVKGVRAAKAVVALEKKIAGLAKQLADLKAMQKKADEAAAAAKAAAAAAKSADEAAAAAKAARKAEVPAAKKKAESQQDAAKGDKDKDCKECGKGKKKPGGKMPQHTVKPCFSAKNLDPSKDKEFARQLKRQEDAINNLTVKEFLDARAHFGSHKRSGTGAAQKEARLVYSRQLQQQRQRENVAKGMSAMEAKKDAIDSTKATMKHLAALHEPDMVAGGKDKVTEMGDKKVNSSIGGQWPSRVKQIDDAANKIPGSDQANTKMNVKLPKCK